AATVWGLTATAAGARTITAARTITVNAGALRAVIQPNPWSLRLVSRAGAPVLTEARGGRPGSAAGAIGLRRGGGPVHAKRAVAGRIVHGTYVARLLTNDPSRRSIAIRISAVKPGVVSVTADGPPAASQTGVGFDRPASERFLGFGERSDAVVRRKGTV